VQHLSSAGGFSSVDQGDLLGAEFNATFWNSFNVQLP
jgi:hypothetical protein